MIGLRRFFIVTLFLAVSFYLPRLQVKCYANNHYAYAIYELSGENGKMDMNMVSKTPNEESCRILASTNPKTQGEWVLLESQCVSGSERDKDLEAVFHNRPIEKVYLSYVNLGGFQTRISFLGLTGNDSPVPGFPIDIPTELIMPTINIMKESLEAQGIKNIKIIYPRKK